MKSIFFALAVFAVCLVQSTNAIQCYKCKSYVDADCAKETYDKKTAITNCDTEVKPDQNKQYKPVTQCEKVTLKDNISPTVERGCHWEATDQKPDTCYVSQGRDIVSCNICKGDLCNSKSGAGRYFALGLTAILAIAAVQFSL